MVYEYIVVFQDGDGYPIMVTVAYTSEEAQDIGLATGMPYIVLPIDYSINS